MTASAWALMLVVNVIIIGATVYSFYRLLTSKSQLGSGD
jgi:hypothetical protein